MTRCNNMQPTVGIIGDGQLALMLAEALSVLNVDFLALSNTAQSSMERTFPDKTTHDSDSFQKNCQVFTLENEFLSVDSLKNLLKEKSEKLFPDLKSYAFFSNKISQRRLYQELGLPSPRWMELITANDLSAVKQNFPFPFMLKASSGGYDGKGIRIIRTQINFDEALRDFKFSEGHELLVEELLAIKQEVAQGFVRNAQGTHTLLPLVETLQVDGVCNLVNYPAKTSSKIAEEIKTMLEKLINYPLVGIFNFEFIIDHNDHVYINEGAPRPHNSQHLTLDASNHSQFDLLARYLTQDHNLPLTVVTKPSAMVNILGKRSGKDYQLKLPELHSSLSVHAKLYGKEISSPGRKMGHVNLVDVSGKLDLVIIGEQILREYDL